MTAKILLSKRKMAMKDMLDHVSTMKGCSRSVRVNQLSVESFRTAFNCKPTPLLVTNLAQTVYNTIYSKYVSGCSLWLVSRCPVPLTEQVTSSGIYM